MSETKERSGIFKFFYVLLSIVTFPIFAVLFVLRHPVKVVMVLALLAIGMIYWPMSRHNVKLSEVLDWYKTQIQTAKFDLAKEALKKGNSDYVPQAVLDEMKKIEEEAEEAKLPKGENYNAKVVRDKKSEDLKTSIKKRGGFKKQDENKKEDLLSEESLDDTQNKETSEMKALVPQGGGLSALVTSKATKDDENVAKEVLPIPQEKVNNAEEPTVSDEVSDEIDLLGEPEDAANVSESVSEKAAEPVTEPKADDEDDEMDLF